MQLSRRFSADSVAAVCSLLIGGLYTGCSSDDADESYDEQIATLAEQTMTRTGEYFSEPDVSTYPIKKK